MESWDIYNKNLMPSGRTFSEGITLKDDELSYIVHIIIRNSEGKYLLQQRALTKKYYPGLWDATCGKVQAGETGLEAAVREVREELGIIAVPCQYNLFFHGIYSNKIVLDMFLLETEKQTKDLILQKSEVENAKYYSFDEMIETLKPNKNSLYMDVLEKIEKARG